MKFYVLVYLNLLLFSNTSFAMDQLDHEFQQGNYARVLLATHPEDFRVQNPQYTGASAVGNHQKAMLTKPYNGEDGIFYNVWPYFVASFHKTSLPQPFEYKLIQQFPNHRRVDFFIVQSIANESAEGQTKFHALKPHYFVHYRAPRTYEGEAFTTALRWTAIPGAVGDVKPLKGSFQAAGFHSDTIDTHPNAFNNMVLSPDNMHVTGINHNNSVDAIFSVAFEDDRGNKIVAIFYTWLLNQENATYFDEVLIGHDETLSDDLQGVSTLRELIHGLEPLDAFKDLLPELQRYVSLLPRMENLQSTATVAHRESLPNKTTVTTDCNANATYQLISNRFAVAESQKIRVSYTLDVQKEGKIALGLLNTNGDGWLAEIPLTAGFHDDFVEISVPEGESSLALVLRNYHLGTPGQSTFTVHRTAVEVAGQPVNIQLDATPYLTNMTSKSGLRKVTTNNNADASYQLVSDRFPVAEGEKVRSSYTLHVQDGGIISLGFLNTLGNDWYPSQTAGETAELILKAGYHKGVMERIVPKGEALAALVVRNYHLPWNGGAGQSTFTLYDLSVDKSR